MTMAAILTLIYIAVEPPDTQCFDGIFYQSYLIQEYALGGHVNRFLKLKNGDHSVLFQGQKVGFNLSIKTVMMCLYFC